MSDFHFVFDDLDDCDFHDGSGDCDVGCDFGVHNDLDVCNVCDVYDGFDAVSMIALMTQICVWPLQYGGFDDCSVCCVYDSLDDLKFVVWFARTDDCDVRGVSDGLIK